MDRRYHTELPMLFLPVFLPATYVSTRSLPSQDLGRASTSSTDVYPDQTSWTDTGPIKLPQQMSDSDKVSPKGPGPGSIISSQCSSFRIGAVIVPTRSEPRPNISNRRPGSSNIYQVVNPLFARRPDYSRLYPTNTVVPQIVFNWHRDLINYCQPTPELSNLAPQPPQSLLKYWMSVLLLCTRRRIFSIFMFDWMFPLF